MNYLLAASQANAEAKIAVLPVWSTFVILLVVVIELMVAGFFLKRKWLETHEQLPIAAAFAMMFLMMSLYVLVGSALYWSSPVPNRPQLLFWLLLLYIPLCIQYGVNLANSLVWRLTLRISPTGVEIPESPVLAQAQKLLMAGKIEEAIALYTTSYERRSPALAEVARLLKSDDKLEEAAAVYQDIVDNHADDRVVWPEAIYSLGKIYETQMNQPGRAIEMYRRLLDEAPDSRFTHLAGADLARLMVMDRNFIKSLHEDHANVAPEDPFIAQRRNFLMERMKQKEKRDNAVRKAAEEEPETAIDDVLKKTKKRKKNQKKKNKSPDNAEKVGTTDAEAKDNTRPSTDPSEMDNNASSEVQNAVEDMSD